MDRKQPGNMFPLLRFLVATKPQRLNEDLFPQHREIPKILANTTICV